MQRLEIVIGVFCFGIILSLCLVFASPYFKIVPYCSIVHIFHLMLKFMYVFCVCVFVNVNVFGIVLSSVFCLVFASPY